MNVLIVHAHENPNSFCSALTASAASWFEAKGYKVSISDLYMKNFDPVGGKNDFINLSGDKYYKYAIEQLHAHQNEQFVPEVSAEMELVEKADILILNFPLWWFGLPAILKGWIDRIFAYGFAYGNDYGFYQNGRFKGRKAFLCITTGSPASFYTLDGMHKRLLPDLLRNIHEGILGLVGYEVLPPFVAYAVSRISDAERSAILKGYKTYLNENV